MDKKIEDKLLKIESELAERPYPPQLVIENTSYCNQKCIHCSHREMKRSYAHMERTIWDKIVEEVGSEAQETEIWPTFYGEALIMGKELWDRIDYADKAGCKNIVLNSNGMLLDRHFDFILASPLKRFILSLDGYTADTYEAIRVGGKRDKVYGLVEELVKRKNSSGQDYPSITCQFSVMERNKDEVEDFRKHWNDLGVEVKVRYMLEWTATGTVRSEVIDYQPGFRIACPWGANTMAIHQNGNAVTCAVDYEGRFVAGNVKDATVRELWAILGDKVRAPHREHRWSDMPKICQGCNDWQVAGAEYEEEKVAGTRPFWYKEKNSEDRVEVEK